VLPLSDRIRLQSLLRLLRVGYMAIGSNMVHSAIECVLHLKLAQAPAERSACSRPSRPKIGLCLSVRFVAIASQCGVPCDNSEAGERINRCSNLPLASPYLAVQRCPLNSAMIRMMGIGIPINQSRAERMLCTG